MLTESAIDELVNQFAADCYDVIPYGVQDPTSIRLQNRAVEIIRALREDLECDYRPVDALKKAYTELGKIVDARMG